MQKWLIGGLILLSLTLRPWGMLPPAHAFPPLTDVNAAVNPFSYQVTFNVYDPSVMFQKYIYKVFALFRILSLRWPST